MAHQSRLPSVNTIIRFAHSARTPEMKKDHKAPVKRHANDHRSQPKLNKQKAAHHRQQAPLSRERGL